MLPSMFLHQQAINFYDDVTLVSTQWMDLNILWVVTRDLMNAGGRSISFAYATGARSRNGPNVRVPARMCMFVVVCRQSIVWLILTRWKHIIVYSKLVIWHRSPFVCCELSRKSEKLRNKCAIWLHRKAILLANRIFTNLIRRL